MDITILEKSDRFGAVARWYAPEGSRIGNASAIVGTFDSRTDRAARTVTFEKREGARDQYRKAVESSIDRGWRIVYRGPRLNDPATS